MTTLCASPARRRPALTALFAFTAIALAACASVPPPTEQMAVSTTSVAQAVSAGGPESAPEEMRMARDKLARANTAMATKDYELARSLAEEAQVDAELAGAKSLSAKTRKAAEVLREDSRALREEMERRAK